MCIRQVQLIAAIFSATLFCPLCIFLDVECYRDHWNCCAAPHTTDNKLSCDWSTPC